MGHKYGDGQEEARNHKLDAKENQESPLDMNKGFRDPRCPVLVEIAWKCADSNGC